MIDQYIFSEKSQRKKQKKSQDSLVWYYLGIVGSLGYSIAIPLVGGALIGSFFNRTLLGIGIGFVVSVLGFIGTIQKIIR